MNQARRHLQVAQVHHLQAVHSAADSAQLKGKKISEAIAWAKENRRTYSWNITSGGNDAVVTQITDDGQNISFTASADQ